MDYAIARHNMVESQIRPNKVTDERLISAMASLPREVFVPKEFQSVAYVDEAIPLGDGRYLMEPLITARLIQAAQPAPGDVALTIGCGTGYGAAVLSHMVSTVVAVECDGGLAQQATQTLMDLGIDTVAVIHDPLEDGYMDQAPYDVIFFDGAVDEIPDVISSQLAEGGRLVAVVAGEGVGDARLVTRHQGELSSRPVFDTGTPSLPGFEGKATFVF